jgi:LPS sulfotransferase NodH
MTSWHPHFGPVGGRTVADWLSTLPEAPAPTKTVVLATDERTGSEWLCQLLAATGVLGRPSEYLNAWWNGKFFLDFPEDVDQQLVIAHRAGTTPNGVFSIKMHAWEMDRMCAASALTRSCPNPVFVRLRRLDLLGQAISLVRARQTERFHGYWDETKPATFDADEIQRVMDDLGANARRWSTYLARNGITPLDAVYEDLVREPDRVVGDIAAFAGITLDAPAAVDRPLRPQRDDTSDEWRRRFVRERGDLDRFDP